MDILYIVGNFSKCDDWEFRFSLRSIDKYGKNIGRVFVCGYCPDWLSDNIIKIPYKVEPYLTTGEKNRNIYRQVIYAVEHSDIGINDNGDFLISMDDHYILNDVDFGNMYPHYVRDYCKRLCRFNLPLIFENGRLSPEYQSLLCSTGCYLKQKGLSYLNFVIHRNMRLNRFIIEELESNGINDEIFNSKVDVECFALIVNYEYSKKNTTINYHFPIEIVKDFKTNNVDILLKYIKSGGKFYSTSDFYVDDDVFNVLYDLFPERSKYEKEEDETISKNIENQIKENICSDSDDSDAYDDSDGIEYSYMYDVI